MILLLSMNEADCLVHQHRRTNGTTGRHNSRRSAYRASGLVRRCIADIHPGASIDGNVSKAAIRFKTAHACLARPAGLPSIPLTRSSRQRLVLTQIEVA